MWFPSSSKELRRMRCENTLAGTSFSWLWPRISESRLSRPAHEIRGMRVQHIVRVGWVSLAVRKGTYIFVYRKRSMSLPWIHSSYVYVYNFEVCIFETFLLDYYKNYFCNYRQLQPDADCISCHEISKDVCGQQSQLTWRKQQVAIFWCNFLVV